MIFTVQNTHQPQSMRALVYDISPVRWAACKVIGRLWPGVFWSGLSGLRLARVPVPVLPSPSWVRLRPVLGGICGTDVGVLLQRQHPANILQAFASRPALLGHENISVVDAVGPAVTRYAPGDRVVVEPTLSCVPREIEPRCRQCAEGHFGLCENFTTGPLPRGSIIGWNAFTGGSWCDYFVAHESQLYRVPDAIGDDQAVLIDPIAGAMHAVLRHPPADDHRVLILGSGPLALGVAMSLRALDCKCHIYALTWSEREGELMQRMGADEYILVRSRDNQLRRYGAVAARVGGKVLHARFGHCALIGGCDMVYECAGSSQALSDAIKYARPRGTVVEVGTSQIGAVDTCPVWFDELTIVGANGRAFERFEGRTLHTYEMVMELIGRGKLDLRGLLTHRFRVERYKEALATLMNKGQTGAIKVAFEHGLAG